MQHWTELCRAKWENTCLKSTTVTLEQPMSRNIFFLEDFFPSELCF